MANDKFAGCFIDESDLYTYDIEWEGMKIATAHTMSAKDRANIERHASKVKYNRQTGDIEPEINSEAMKTWYILGAIETWELGRPVTEDNVDKLEKIVRDHLFSAIQDHENRTQGKVEDTEKN